jgi:alkanesulfonate monooxygenase SsuD/methylene tetrahydromethanopterin reductase-like flavin-dependent oxidoreductase (luciferase family)
MTDHNTVVHPWVAAGKDRLRFGTNLPGFGDWLMNRDYVQALEGLGYDSGMYGEHPSLGGDCWTTLAAYAAVTTRLRLVSISCVYYRSPEQLARCASDLDLLSGGRLVLGLGAGWAKGDFDCLGIPFPGDAERVRYLDETIRTIRAILADPPTVSSEIFGYAFSTRCAVDVVQKPYIPILVAGAGEKVILRQVAEYGDMANIEAPKAPTPDDVRRKLDLVDRLSAKKGRLPGSIVRSHFLNNIILAEDQDEANRCINALPPFLRDSPFFSGMTPSDLVAYYRPLIDAGVDYLYFSPIGMDISMARLFAEKVMPELHDYYVSMSRHAAA